MYDDDDIDSESDGSSRIVGSIYCSESTDPISDLLSDSYFELDVFLCKG